MFAVSLPLVTISKFYQYGLLSYPKYENFNYLKGHENPIYI